ncbi:MAG: hypothetical protein U0931_16725 [Vulcanimicrobiota bacterium]
MNVNRFPGLNPSLFPNSTHIGPDIPDDGLTPNQRKMGLRPEDLARHDSFVQGSTPDENIQQMDRLRRESSKLDTVEAQIRSLRERGFEVVDNSNRVTPAAAAREVTHQQPRLPETPTLKNPETVQSQPGQSKPAEPGVKGKPGPASKALGVLGVAGGAATAGRGLAKLEQSNGREGWYEAASGTLEAGVGVASALGVRAANPAGAVLTSAEGAKQLVDGMKSKNEKQQNVGWAKMIGGITTLGGLATGGVAAASATAAGAALLAPVAAGLVVGGILAYGGALIYEHFTKD